MQLGILRHSSELLMPSSPATQCLDCARRALTGSKYCTEHQTHNNASSYRRLYDRYRADDPVRALYSSRRWTSPLGTRETVLRRCNRLCVECGCKSATVADHYPLSARQIVAELGVAEFYNPDRCRGLCKPCHDSSTAKREGFAKPTIASDSSSAPGGQALSVNSTPASGDVL